MKEELQGKLVEILTSIQSAAGKASDFAMEQLPDIAQSYVVYGRAYLTCVVVAAVLGMVLGYAVLWHYHLKNRGRAYYDGFPAIVGAAVLSMTLGSVVAVNFGSMLLVWFAPKVWLLKEIASMVK